MTLNNADKGILSVDDPALLARIRQFTHFNQEDSSECNLVLTNQGLFINKALLMPQCHFVIGYDTYVRILNPFYYGNSQENMKNAL